MADNYRTKLVERKLIGTAGTHLMLRGWNTFSGPNSELTVRIFSKALHFKYS